MAFLQFCLNIPIALLVFVVSTLPVLCFYVVRIVYKYKQKFSNLNNCIGYVPATVTQITLDNQTWRDGWVIKAAWVDQKTRQSYVFSSQPQEMLPVKHVGDSVLVLINSHDPIRYTMEL